MSRPLVGSVDHLFPAGSLDQVNSWQPKADAEGKLVLPAKMKAVVKQAIGSKKKKRKAESESESEEEEKPKRAKSAAKESGDREWSPAEDAKIIRECSKGRWVSDVAADMGLPSQVVKIRYAALKKEPTRAESAVQKEPKRFRLKNTSSEK